jgi:Sister chromatid cohesion protein Dcc1
MEVPARLIDVLTEGQTLVIRGDGADSAVLCSGDTTFDLKEAETSNSFLLLEGLHYPDNNENSKT